VANTSRRRVLGAGVVVGLAAIGNTAVAGADDDGMMVPLELSRVDAELSPSVSKLNVVTSDLSDDDFNYLEAVPTENVVATEANVAFAPPSLSMAMNTFGGRALVAACCTCTAELITMPLDNVKVREHVRVFEEGQRVVSLGELSAVEIMEAGGLAAFWSGLVPGLQHHFLSGGVKIGLYEPVKAAVFTALPTGTSSLIVSALAGMACGVAGIAAANPTDVVKVRQQGRAEDDAPLGNLLQQYAGVVRESGVLGLWAGFAPNAARSASISGLEFMGYDWLRTWLLLLYPTMSVPVAAGLAGGVAGGVCGLLINPIDVVKSRMMCPSCVSGACDTSEACNLGEAYAIEQARAAEASATTAKKGMLAFTDDLLAQDGMAGLMRGVVPGMVRVAIFDGLVFFFNESLRAAILQHHW